MIDYGLFALIVVVLTLIFLAFHAWRGIKAEGERISAQASKVDAELAKIVLEVHACKSLAAQADTIAKEVQGTHYKALLRRIDEAEATGLGCLKQCEALAEKCASLGARMSNLARWAKRDQAAGETAGDAAGETAGEQVPMFPAAPVPPSGNVHVTGHFGRMARKVG